MMVCIASTRSLTDPIDSPSYREALITIDLPALAPSCAFRLKLPVTAMPAVGIGVLSTPGLMRTTFSILLCSWVDKSVRARLMRALRDGSRGHQVGPRGFAVGILIPAVD